MPPSCSIALSAMFCASPSTVRSPRTTATLPPCASMSAATAYVRFGCRPWIATATPSVARARTIASPKPMLLPVTSARFPCNLKSIAEISPSEFRPRLASRGGFGQAYPVKRREIVIRGIEHKRVQLAAANADIAAGEKRQRHSVLKQTGERQFVAITVDADNPHKIGNDSHRCFRSEHLGVDSELECAWCSRIERTACMPAQHPRSLDRRLRIGQRIADCLMMDDLLDASTPLALGERKGKLESSAHQRYTEDADEGRAPREALRGKLESAPLLSQQVSGRNLNRVQAEARHEMGTVSQRDECVLKNQAAVGTRHSDDRDATRGFDVGIGAADDGEKVGTLSVPSGGRGYPLLPARDDPRVANSPRGGAHAFSWWRRSDVGAAAGLGQGKCGQRCALGCKKGRQKPLALLWRAANHQRRKPEHCREHGE